MKKSILLTAIIIVMAFFSCKKESQLHTPPSNPSAVPNSVVRDYPENPFSYSDLIGNLTSGGSDISGTACLGKLFFSSTDSGSSGVVTNVDIFDITSKSKTTFPLSKARQFITAVSSDSKVFFAGGFDGKAVSRVDIYDVKSSTWSTAELSIPRYQMAATAYGDKMYFAGGINGAVVSRVDIYDITNNSWSTAELSVARKNLGAVTLGNKVLFCGGSTGGNDLSTTVDIYDMVAQKWSATEMPFAISDVTAVVLNNKAYFGGRSFLDIEPIINIYSDAGNHWEDGISFPEITNDFKTGGGNGIIFAMGQRNKATDVMVTINISQDWWESGYLKNDISGNALISYQESVYCAGGVINAGTKKVTGVYRVIL